MSDQLQLNGSWLSHRSCDLTREMDDVRLIAWTRAICLSIFSSQQLATIPGCEQPKRSSPHLAIDDGDQVVWCLQQDAAQAGGGHSSYKEDLHEVEQEDATQEGTRDQDVSGVLRRRQEGPAGDDSQVNQGPTNS